MVPDIFHQKCSKWEMSPLQNCFHQTIIITSIAIITSSSRASRGRKFQGSSHYILQRTCAYSFRSHQVPMIFVSLSVKEHPETQLLNKHTAHPPFPSHTSAIFLSQDSRCEVSTSRSPEQRTCCNMLSQTHISTSSPTTHAAACQLEFWSLQRISKRTGICLRSGIGDTVNVPFCFQCCEITSLARRLRFLSSIQKT